MKKRKHATPTETNHAAGENARKTGAQTPAPTTEERIRRRAQEIHQARGGAPGHELDDWLQAEREIKGGG